MAEAGVMAGPSPKEIVGVLPRGCPTPQDIWHNLDAPWRDRVQAQKISTGAVVLINEADPSRFLANLWAGLLADAAIVLANPGWRQQEWQQVAEQLSPDIILGEPPPVSFGAARNRPEPGQILIATGGTSGRLKFVIHTWATLTAAAQGFLAHFSQQPINSYCVLPLHHVSGLMQAMRVWLSGGRLVIQSFKQLEAGQRLITPDASWWFISLVPTQLQRLIADPGHVAWLAQFRAILLGGAPAWPDLLARVAQLPIALTYGMSETAAQVATLLPEDFQRGMRSSGRSLPHVQLAIHPLESPQQQPVDTVGRIALKTTSLCLGYWLDKRFAQTQGWFYPDDLGYLDRQGYLHVVGRHSQKIITGGENVFPAEVEAALMTTRLVQDACVVGVPDPVWGQAVAALYVPVDETSPHQLKTALQPILSAYKHPKHWRPIDQIPRNQQGKVNRSQVKALLIESTGPAQHSEDAADGS